MRRQHWTLIETFVVISIAAILVGLLVPAIIDARDKVRAVKEAAFQPGDIVELVLDKRKAMVLRVGVFTAATGGGQIELRVAGSDGTVLRHPHELRLLERPVPVAAPGQAGKAESPWR